MHNFFTNQKKTAQLGNKEQMKHKQIGLILKRQRKNKHLIDEYVQRTIKSVHCEDSDEESLTKYQEFTYKPRPEDKSKNLGPPAFYFRDRTSKERVSNAIKENQNLDKIPFCMKRNQTEYSYREVDKSLRIKPNFSQTDSVRQKFKQTQLNRFASHIDDGSKIRHSHFSINENKKKSAFPLLNEKKHPKTKESVKMKLLTGAMRMMNQSMEDVVEGQKRKEESLLRKHMGSENL